MTYDELMESILTAKVQILQHCIEANSVTLNGRKYGKLIENLPPSLKPTVFGMAVKADYALPDDCDFLVQYEPPQPQTNADRIRSMTDEELADFMISHAACTGLVDESKCLVTDASLCDRCWLDWLKEESK